MSRADVLNRDALTAKYRIFRDWRETRRPESLTVWTTSRLEDGSLIVSSQVRGPDPAGALREFVAWQTHALAERGVGDGWEVPLLDVDVPGRISCVWQQDGVWIRLWYVDAPTAAPASRPRRWFPGGRLTFTRNRRKETTV